ncbi:MAG: winged helix-turn-helix transcriptional regulator [Candidatus Methylomirabilis sp.]
MRPDHHRDLQLLSEIEASEVVTQRGLAKRLGIALGLTNLYLKRLAKKGCIKVVNIQKNRIRYLITAKGIAEKSRLTYEYMQYSLQLYRQARIVLRARFHTLASQGRKRMVFYGVGEAAELAYLCAREMDLELVGVVDADHAGSRFLDHTVLDPTVLPRLEYDCVVITSFDDGLVPRRQLEEMGVVAGTVVTMKP